MTNLVSLLLSSIGAAVVAAPPLTTFDGIEAAVATARTQLSRGEASAAVRTLEDALTVASETERASVVPALVEAYREAVTEAERRHENDDANEYRVSLQILETATGKARPAQPISHVQNQTKPLPAIERADLPAMKQPQSVAAPELFPEDTEATHSGDAEPAVAAAPAPSTPARDSADALCGRADTLFRQRQFTEANAIYHDLSQRKELPQSRLAAWAYCRRLDVFQRINAASPTKSEWQSILGEIDAIHKLSPHWFDEYLRSLALEKSNAVANSGARRAAAGTVRNR